MTQKQIDEIRARCEAATLGPWRVGRTYEVMTKLNSLAIVKSVDDVDFIAHARQDIPDLLADRDRLTARVKALEAAIRRCGAACSTCYHKSFEDGLINVVCTEECLNEEKWQFDEKRFTGDEEK